MDWFRIRPARLLTDIRRHRLSLEAQGVLLQLCARAASLDGELFDGELSADALLDELRPMPGRRKREALLEELAPVLTTYLADVAEQSEAYRQKSAQARAAIQARWRRARDTSVCTDVPSGVPSGVPTPVHTEREKERSTPLPPKGDDGFVRFWEAYPKKAAKAAARKAWLRLAPDQALIGDILAALRWQRASSQWTRDDGQYVPLPATWLNGRRWEDARPLADTRKLPTPDWEAAS